MSCYVFDIPADDDLCIIIGDTFLGATLTLSSSPGTGTYFAVLESRSDSVPFDVVQNTPTELVISMSETVTLRLKTGRFEWSLLFRETATGNDRTICRGYANVVDYPTSQI